MKKGFTLLELLVVVLIIGILAAIALPQYQKAVEKARAVEILSMVNTLSKSSELYLLSGKTDPIGIEDLEINVNQGTVASSGSYYTKTAKYAFGCSDGECTIETYRKSCYTGNVLNVDNCTDSDMWTIARYWRNGKITGNFCYSQLTKTGTYICKWLESQGFEFVDGEL